MRIKLLVCVMASCVLLWGCARRPSSRAKGAGPTPPAKKKAAVSKPAVAKPSEPPPPRVVKRKEIPKPVPVPALGQPEDFAGTKTASFETQQEIARWEVKGDVSVDLGKDREGGPGGALRVGPGGSAVWKARDVDGSGKVVLWVYEDGTAAKKPKVRGAGGMWGLIQKDGRVLTPGAIYAPYLSGATTYAVGDYNPAGKEKPYFSVQYLGIKRTRGWHRWTFDFDADKGLKILYEGKDVNARRRRFDWNKTRLHGFVGVAVFGDTTPGGKQAVWIDDVRIAFGGPAKVKPVPPPPPPPATPEKDPAPQKPVDLIDAVRGKHPRLLFSAEDVPALKRFAQGEGKRFFEALKRYLPASKAPDHTKFLTDATDAQRQGLWRLPTVALHYVLTGEKRSFDRTVAFMKKLADMPQWETGRERDAGMGAANIMIGAALAYDWLYHDLDPEFRARYRRKLLLHARRMYHHGHLNKIKSIGYWQNDTHNNHRWHRDAGLALCALTVAEEGPEDDWIVAKTHEELSFVAKWLPADGTSHEGSSYLVFGGAHLTLAMQASDRCLGTEYLKLPFFKHVVGFRLHSLTPGMKGAFHYGDSGGLGAYNNFLFKCAAVHRQRDEQAGLDLMLALNKGAFEFHWFSMVWYDPTLKGGSVSSLPTSVFYPDMGLAYVRDGWEAAGAAAMFKCGPYGGHKLNEYRNTNNYHYINVAHDDPDANSFLLYARGALLAETSRYSKKKRTSSHNTILVNGKGQRGEGQGWTQPFKRGDKDMTKTAVVTAWKDAGEVVLVEGEAGGAYPDLTRYRRTFVWVKGKYILVLDDIRAGKAVEVTWLVQGPKLEAVAEGDGRYRLKKGETVCEFQVVSGAPFERAIRSSTIRTSTADHRGKPLGWQQLALSRRGAEWRLASVYDLWNRGGLRVSSRSVADGATVTVRGPGFTDTWHWTPAAGRFAPSTLRGALGDGRSVVLDEKDVPPAP